MNHIASPPEPLIREIPLCRLTLAPENVRKTPPDNFAQVQLRASIKAHGLLENLVARADGADTDGIECFAVVAGGRRLAALKALAEDGTFHADHPVPCKIAANGDAGELSLAENIIRIAMHPAGPGGRVQRARRGRRHRGRHRRAFRRQRAHRRAAAPARQCRARAAGCLPGRRDRPRDAEGIRRHHRPRPPAGDLGARGGPGLPAVGVAGEAPADRGAGAGRIRHGALCRRRRIRGRGRPGSARSLRRRARERRLARRPGAPEPPRHREVDGRRRRADDPLEVGRSGAGRRLERHRALRPYPSRARPADDRGRPPRSRSCAPVTTSSSTSTKTTGPTSWSRRPKPSSRDSTQSRPGSRHGRRSGGRISRSPAASSRSGATARSR